VHLLTGEHETVVVAGALGAVVLRARYSVEVMHPDSDSRTLATNPTTERRIHRR